MADKSVITNLEARMRQLIGEHRRLSELCRELTTERNTLKAQGRAQQEQIRSLENELSLKQLAEGLTGRSPDKKATARVNRLMREVDKCIALLGRAEAAGKDV